VAAFTYKENNMSDCLHCDIHDLLQPHLENDEVNVAEIAAKVTEVLADLILLTPVDDQPKFIADVLINLGQFVLQKIEGEDTTDEPKPRRH
jgi:hypothetical protein